MKILQVNVVYKVGSTGKITADLHNELLRKGHQSVVCCSRLKNNDDKNVINLCNVQYSRFNVLVNRFSGFLHGGCFISTNKLINNIKKEKPDIVHLQCINGAFVNIHKLLKWLNKNHIKTICTLHAEFMYTGGCSYTIECDKWKTGCGNCERIKTELRSLFFDRTHQAWMRMKKAIEGFAELTLVPVSQWIGNQVAQSPIYAGIPQQVIHNGINVECFGKIDSHQAELIKRKYNIPLDKKIVLHVTPNFAFEEKGGEYFKTLVEMLPEDYFAVVVGNNAPSTDKIIGINFLENQQELAYFYSMADVFVITSKNDNYPTVCLEANCCGTAVVGFDVGGVKETIGQGMGDVVPPFNVEMMCEKVIYWANNKASIPQKLYNDRVEYCNKKRMANDYLDLYQRIIKDNI